MKSKRIEWFWFLGLVALATLVSASPALAQRYTTLTQYASGDGWSSDVFLTNQAAQAATGIVVSFYGNDGLPMTVEANIGTASSFTLNLNPGASQIIRIASTGSLKVGYVVVKAPTPGSIIVTEVFRYIQAGTVVAELGVPQLGRHHHYSFPVEINTAQGINTGVALANPTYDSTAAFAQTLIVNLTNSNGTFFGRALVPLGLGAHMAKYLNEAGLFPGLDNFTGVASVSGARNFGVLGLRQDRQAFGAVAVDYGAALTPFVVPSPTLGEAESNNSTASAQYLTASCIINGAISSAGDLDYFSFDGRMNDVVSFMVSTQGMGSSLDSVLTLYKNDGTQYATSDQNGLYGQDDSLVHVVLPENGRYYVKVSDYFSSGGANYGYQLHVLVPVGTGPSISSLNPTSAAPGSSTTLIISGINLTGASAVTFNPSTGINVTSIQSTATQVTAQLTIASDAPAGNRSVTVTTPGGTSNALTFAISGGGTGYAGTWVGTPSTGGTMTFTVSSDNKVMSFEFANQQYVVGCCLITRVSASSSVGAAITGNSFTIASTSSSPGGVSFNFSGTFSSNTQSSGTFSGTLNAPIGNPCCTGSFGSNWNASKSSPAAESQVAEEGPPDLVLQDENGTIIKIWFGPSCAGTVK